MLKILILFLLLLNLYAKEFIVASYNIQNLFDLKYDGLEYEEYIPEKHFWNRKNYNIKIKNISKVIKDLNPDIVALQEIESIKALKDLNKNLGYRFFAISKSRNSPIKNAVLSKFPIIKKEEIEVNDLKRARNILKVTIKIDKKPLIIFINHWKSKHAPESVRLLYAKKLKKEIKKLDCKEDFIVLGDFNSNYNEFKTLLYEPKLNDTGGITAINHILPTTYKKHLVDEDIIKKRCGFLYNLWLEILPIKRFSYLFRGKKNTLDNILLPKSMFDNYGINYIDNSFNVFRPPYLYKNRKIFRWRIYHKKGIGYSDHLPIYAKFSTKPFEDKDEYKIDKIDIKTLYKYHKKEIDTILEDAYVILKYKNIAVIKREKDRAIMAYNPPKNLKEGNIYDIEISKIKKYKNNLEIFKIENIVLKETPKKIDNLYLLYNNQNLSNKKYQNEIVKNLTGIYKNGYLYYKKGKIKLYFAKKSLVPKNNSKIYIKRAHIRWYYKPQIVIYEKKDFLIP